MLRRTLGNSGIEASVVAFGAWAIGGWRWGGSDDDAAIRAIHAAIDQGINFIDTAPIYGFGRSEEVVGRAISDRRDSIVLASKCGMHWDKKAGRFFFSSTIPDTSGGRPVDIHIFQGPESIRNEVEQSLRRLNTDYIDLMQTHWQDPTTPIEETMEALIRLKEEGKIRAIGVCNAEPDQMRVYQGAGPLASDQEKFSMLDRQHASAQRQFAAEEGLAYLAYSPLAQGLLTGKVGPDRQFPADDQRSEDPRFALNNRKRILAMLDEFSPVAEAHRITPAQLIIAWTYHQHGCTHVLAGARNEMQVAENAAAGEVELTAEELTLMQGILDRRLPEIT